MSNNCDDSSGISNDIVFFRLWRNTVIKQVIFRYSRLYKKNKEKSFSNLKELREYGEREYITKLVYSNASTRGEPMEIGDLPCNGVLVQVDLSSFYTPIKCYNIIPQGVEIIRFNLYDQVQLSELPSSVHTISNVALKTPYIDNQIPNNITSLSFSSRACPNEFYDISLPNSIVKLDLGIIHHCFSRFPIVLPLPSSVTDLIKSNLGSLYNTYCNLFTTQPTTITTPISVVLPQHPSNTFIPSSVTELTSWCSEEYRLRLIPIIPSTVCKLRLFILGNGHIEKGLVPYGVKELSIGGSNFHSDDIRLSEGCLPDSITKLTIYRRFGIGVDINIQPNSIPNSVLDLEIHFTRYPKPFKKNMFPKSLTRLVVSSDRRYDTNSPPTLSELPTNSLKYLNIDDNEIKIQ